ncbi:MAG TPA: helix-turn-helix domain-containing protein [Conexibacter sp.]|nr:helix-turn-helix domain-containing protein [Conexibacter sp.]
MSVSDDVWTVDEVAARAKVSKKTVHRAIDAGDLQAAPLGEAGALRILEEWFQDWMRDRARLHAERRAARSASSPGAVAAAASRRSRRRGTLTVHEGMGKTR